MHYDGLTREYNVSCTVGRAATVTHFEDILTQYEPMISASIRQLNIYRDHDSFRQTGRIALWQAWNRFDQEKGNFTPFAFRSIRGAMLDELKKESRFEEFIIQMEEGALEFIPDGVAYDWSDRLADALARLSFNERELIQWLFIEGLTLAECAAQIGITVAGVKKRRERMLVKLRAALL